MSAIAIIIPARYGSTRFPGKPLALIAGRPMLARVVDIAVAACARIPDAQFAVATEDQRIVDFCRAEQIPVTLTGDDCPTGSDRVAQAVGRLGWNPDIVLGLQGDAPFTPLNAVIEVIATLRNHPQVDVSTPVVPLRWVELDKLRTMKITTPFSGTTAILTPDDRAIWFSKNIIPAIRGEDKLRAKSEFSPILQHLGLYGFRYSALRRFLTLPPSTYETLEGLEQLRLIENGLHVRGVRLNIDLGLAQAGVDSPEDLARAEAVIAQYGEPRLSEETPAKAGAQ